MAPAPASRLERIAKGFYLLLPMLLATVGLGYGVAMLIVPDLRDPPTIAALTGLLTVVGTVGFARRESK